MIRFIDGAAFSILGLVGDSITFLVRDEKENIGPQACLSRYNAQRGPLKTRDLPRATGGGVIQEPPPLPRGRG